MDLTAGIQKLIQLKEIYNAKCIEITPIGGNIRFIDLTNTDINKVGAWTVRTAEETIALTNASAYQFDVVTAGDEKKIRLGEIVELYDVNGDYVGSGFVTKIDGLTVHYTRSANKDFSATAGNVTQLILRKDPVLLDEHSKPIRTIDMPYLIVQSDSDIELSISMLHTGLEL